MKRILFTMIIANALIILSLGSCTKEDLTYPIVQPMGDSQQYPITIDNLVAGRWIKNEAGHYVSALPAVVSSINTGNHAINIYLITTGKETLIDPSISYMGGTLWAEVTNNNLELDFLPADNIFPFSYLVIKIVIV